MYEMMTTNRGSGGYPFSGPGSKILRAGDTSYGFFAEVPGPTMGVAHQLLELVQENRTLPAYETNNISWAKFFHNGKVLFIPTGTIATTTYNVLQQNGLTFDATQSPPDVPTILPFTTNPMYEGNPVVVAKDGTMLRVRLIRAFTDKYFGTLTTANIPEDSELNRLIRSVFMTGVVNPIGVKLTNTYMAVISYTQNVTTAAGGSVIVFNANGGSFTVSTTIVNNTIGWIPVLEVIDPSQMETLLFPPLLQYPDSSIESNSTHITIVPELVAQAPVALGIKSEVAGTGIKIIPEKVPKAPVSEQIESQAVTTGIDINDNTTRPIILAAAITTPYSLNATSNSYESQVVEFNGFPAVPYQLTASPAY